MIQMVTVSRDSAGGKYEDVLDVCEELARGDYGSATNALNVMARQSPLFVETMSKLQAERASATDRN